MTIGSKNLNDQVRSLKLWILRSFSKKNPASSTWRVLGELSISQFSGVCHLHNFGKSICISWIELHKLTPSSNIEMSGYLQGTAEKPT